MKNLIIVESFTKTKTISNYLNNKYDVIASFGHINNLPKNDLGIDTNTWIGSYIETNDKIIKNIRKYTKKADNIYIASDPDLEGEAISYHIKNIIKDLLYGKKCYRICFNEITKDAIINAINNPRDINFDIVSAQETRRFVDRLVGYRLSPILWNKFDDNTLSVGRVQSVALHICINKFNEIKNIEIDLYWIIKGFYSNYEFKLYDNNELLKISKITIVNDILSKLHFNKTYSIEYIEKKSLEHPKPPYITTTLQQDAYLKFKFTSKKTLLLAQQLYENGLITYMRTDSTTISNEFKNVIIKYINENYGKDYSKYRTYKSKVVNAQEAHEAIRITNINCTNLTNETNLSEDHNKLYILIWKRTVSSQMIDAEYCNLDIIIKYPEFNTYLFKHTKTFLVKVGFLIVYERNKEDISSFKKNIGDLNITEYISESSIDNQPTLYNEISLIKRLEKEGIGRPSTYSTIIDKILSKKYVVFGSNPQEKIKSYNIIKTLNGIKKIDNIIDVGGKNKDLLVPTNLGININNYLELNIPYLIDLKFTSNMELCLDKICTKEKTKNEILDNFYKDFIKPVQIVSSTKNNISSGVIKTKYGYCYYNSITKKYTNIESYLDWKKIKAEELNENDIIFLSSLPKKLDDNSYLHIGRYGLYKKVNNINQKIDKNTWHSFIS